MEHLYVGYQPGAYKRVFYQFRVISHLLYILKESTHQASEEFGQLISRIQKCVEEGLDSTGYWLKSVQQLEKLRKEEQERRKKKN